jgi:catechol 2,3-dioxygenase-like lactoylglutathione lyase family enzyme
MNATYPVICAEDIDACREFYISLFGFRSVFEVDFYVHLSGGEGVQLGFVKADHESVPDALAQPAAGVFVTIESDDVDALHERARSLAIEVVHPLRDEEWGQRHFMVRDPAGLLVDVVKYIPPTREFLLRHGIEAAAT